MMRKLVLLGFALGLFFSGPGFVPAPAEAGTSSVSASKSKAKKTSKAKSRHKHRIKTRISNRTSAVQQVAYSADGSLQLASSKALVVDQQTGEVLYGKSSDLPTPIASVTKLMTAMVVLDAGQPLDEMVSVTSADVDTLKGTGSRLRVGTTLSREEMLHLALMSSENRAASALGHAYPGGYDAFVHAMNVKATMLGMSHSHFVDATGLDSRNISTAEDLVRMTNAAYEYPEIRQLTTSPSYSVDMAGNGRYTEFINTNALVRKGEWNIGLSKTGFINEAGRCLVMQAQIAGKPLIIVLLDSVGKYTRIGDANRIRKWVEGGHQAPTTSG